MTSFDTDKIKECLKMLKTTHAGKGFMHGSFNKDDLEQYSRDWFAWANTLFGEPILKIYKENRDILTIEY
ncbi:MAG: hypothetical protein CR994_04460 [Maribacter sp.]|nr:MAG: hypothetical protein CR994_04460 [Maribacter sp.]